VLALHLYGYPFPIITEADIKAVSGEKEAFGIAVAFPLNPDSLGILSKKYLQPFMFARLPISPLE
jgi:hypothetical protein